MSFSKNLLKPFNNDPTRLESFINESAETLVSMDDVRRRRFLSTNQEVQQGKIDYNFQDITSKNGKYVKSNPIDGFVHFRYHQDVNTEKPLPPVSGSNRMFRCI